MNKHPEDVKATVVNRYLNGEQISKISHDMNISRTTIYTWVKQHNNSFNKANTAFLWPRKKNANSSTIAYAIATDKELLHCLSYSFSGCAKENCPLWMSYTATDTIICASLPEKAERGLRKRSGKFPLLLSCDALSNISISTPRKPARTPHFSEPWKTFCRITMSMNSAALSSAG